jgi:hypothetical protein
MRARSLIAGLSVAAVIFAAGFSMEAYSQGHERSTYSQSEQKLLVLAQLDPGMDPKDWICTWRGKAPICKGNCQGDETMVRLDKCGGGNCCRTGSKAYCCRPRR